MRHRSFLLFAKKAKAAVHFRHHSRLFLRRHDFSDGTERQALPPFLFLKRHSASKKCTTSVPRWEHVQSRIRAGLLTRAFAFFSCLLSFPMTDFRRRIKQSTYSDRYRSGFSPDSLFTDRTLVCGTADTLCVLFYLFRSILRKNLPNTVYHTNRAESSVDTYFPRKETIIRHFIRKG